MGIEQGEMPGPIWYGSSETRRVKQRSQDGHAINQARTRSAEEGGGINGKDSTVSYRREILPSRMDGELIEFTQSPVDREAARHQDQHVRLCGKELLPRHLPGGSAR